MSRVRKGVKYGFKYHCVVQPCVNSAGLHEICGFDSVMFPVKRKKEYPIFFPFPIKVSEQILLVRCCCISLQAQTLCLLSGKFKRSIGCSQSFTSIPAVICYFI